MGKAPTSAQALKAAKVLLEYYEDCNTRVMLDGFIDMMITRLKSEIARLERK